MVLMYIYILFTVRVATFKPQSSYSLEANKDKWFKMLNECNIYDEREYG